MPLPEPLTAKLSSRARSILTTSQPNPPDQNVLALDKRILHALQGLREQRQLQLTPDVALDIAIVYPTRAVSGGLFTSNVIALDELVHSAREIANSFPSSEELSQRTITREEIRVLRLMSKCLESALVTWPEEVAKYISNDRAPSSLLARLPTYYAALNRAAKILGGGRWNLADVEPETWKLDSVHAKTSLLQILHCLITSCEKSELADLLFVITADNEPHRAGEEDGSGNASSSTPIPFVDRSLLGDYDAVFRLRHRLRGLKNSSREDARIDLLEQIIGSVPGIDDPTPGGITFLLPKEPKTRRGASALSAATPAFIPRANVTNEKEKGKGKAKAPVEVHFSSLSSFISEYDVTGAQPCPGCPNPRNPNDPP
jgi:hypothetical protein